MHEVVLLDLARYRSVDRIVAGNPISQHELESAAQKQGVQIGEGDVVLVRTGNGALWQDPEVYLQAGGVTGSASQWLASKGVMAVGADNMAWDEMGLFDPDFKVTLPGHLILLVRSGIYIIENLFLEELARDQRYEFTFVCLPLKLEGRNGFACAADSNCFLRHGSNEHDSPLNRPVQLCHPERRAKDLTCWTTRSFARRSG